MSEPAASAEVTPATNPRVRRVILAGGLCAGGLAALATAVETFLAIFSGSYIAWSVTMAVLFVWMAAAFVGAIALGVLLLPVLVLAKGRLRAAILPGLIVTAGYAAAVLDLREILVDKDVLGGGIFLSTIAVAVAAVFMGTVSGFLVFRRCANPGVPVIGSMLAAVIVPVGVAYFVPPEASLFVLFAGPLVMMAALATAFEAVKSTRTRAGISVLCTLVLAGVLTAVGIAFGDMPLGPIDETRDPDPGRAAMLAGKPNVIVITLDTTRADRMSLCGYGIPTTPNLEKLAADCRFFPYGVSVNSWTLPSHASLFTGKYPREHGAHSDTEEYATGMEKSILFGIPLARSQLTMANYLSMAGYNTAAFVANYSWLCRQFGIDQGFDYYHDTPRVFVFKPGGSRLYRNGIRIADLLLRRNGKFQQSYWSARDVTSFGESWVRRNKSAPFFLFLNYMDPHEPYNPPPPFDNIDGLNLPQNPLVSQHIEWQTVYGRYIKTGQGITPEILRDAGRQYDGELAYMDHYVGRFVDTLKAEGVYDDTLLIVLSDHGEFFGEHQLLNHGVGLYEGGLRVPILVKYPAGEHAGEVIDARVSIADVFGTVFDVLDLPTDDVTAEPLQSVTHPILAEDYEKGNNVKRYGDRFRRSQITVYEGDWKYTRVSNGRHELYNLAEDPAESENVYHSEGDTAARLDARISKWLSETPAFDGAAETADEMSPEALRRIQALGYASPGRKR